MRHVLVYIIRIYQKVSRYKRPCCRYWPSCSDYAAQAILRHGPVRGIGMAAWRLLRCNPWTAGGIDPVK